MAKTPESWFQFKALSAEARPERSTANYNSPRIPGMMAGLAGVLSLEPTQVVFVYDNGTAVTYDGSDPSVRQMMSPEQIRYEDAAQQSQRLLEFGADHGITYFQ